MNLNDVQARGPGKRPNNQDKRLDYSYLGGDARKVMANRTNAPIKCSLKKSDIIWAKCSEARKTHHCLCFEARERLRYTFGGLIELRVQLRRTRQPFGDLPEGWEVKRNTRFSLVYNEKGEVVHRASSVKGGDNFAKLMAEVAALRTENGKLWKLLRDQIVGEFEETPSLLDMLDDTKV